jgi:vitamin B12 transport system substrate-binding protein
MLVFKPVIMALLLVFVIADTYANNTVERRQQRIIALSPHSVELIYLLGAGDRIIATTSFADYPEAAKSIPVIGGYNGIQIEKALALEPDLIVAWEGGNKADDLVQLERLGLKVYRSQTRNLAGIADEILNLGKLMDLEERAKAEADSFIDRLATIKAANTGKPPVAFFYQLWSEPLRTMAGKSWINEMLTGCGGRNIFDESAGDYPQVSMETVLEREPDAIIIPSHHGHGSGEGDFWQKWPEIPAVKNKHIYYVNGDILHRFSVRALDGMQTICALFDQVRATNSND